MSVRQHKSTPDHSALRAWWYQEAVKFAQHDCCLLCLLPWEDRTLSKLPGDVYSQLLVKLDELVTEACRAEIESGTRAPDSVLRLNCAIWNFLKPWNRSPDVPPYAQVSRGTESDTQHSTPGVTT